MPDLANISSATLRSINESTDSPPATLYPTPSGCRIKSSLHDGEACYGGGVMRLRGWAPKKVAIGKCRNEHVRAWVQKKTEMGVPESHCYLPFLVGAPKMVECLACHDIIHPGEEVPCSVRDCKGVYHSKCVKEILGISTVQRKFKCPQHACFICKGILHWRCVRCTVASHDKCAPWSDEVIHLKDLRRQAVCWRHPTDWRLDNPAVTRLIYLLNQQHSVPASGLGEIFGRLPLPYVDEEFKLNLTSKDMVRNKLGSPYVHIKRSVYLVEKKHGSVDDGCRSCSTVCSKNCECRALCISCSKACSCSEDCTNRPFCKKKKIRIVKTELCGWGVEAAEPIRKGDFIIEYVGEGSYFSFCISHVGLRKGGHCIIDNTACEQRLWAMKDGGAKNFYMCEVRKDFIIDATFKGNASRFLNHSCEPNCTLDKWHVEGEIRLGMFAARSIKDGEQLTYNYRFVEYGVDVRCHCGAASCKGIIGTKKKMGKGMRTSTTV